MENLISAATTLCYVLISLGMVAIAKLTMSLFDDKKNTINIEGVTAEDNFYTQLAAEEHKKAAIANREAAEASLKAEELRLMRAKLASEV